MSSARRVPAVRDSALTGSNTACLDTYLTIRDVAGFLKISEKTVRNRMYNGIWRRGEHWFHPRGSRPYFKQSALVRWMEERDSSPLSLEGLAYGQDIPRDRPRSVTVDAKRRAAV